MVLKNAMRESGTQGPLKALDQREARSPVRQGKRMERTLITPKPRLLGEKVRGCERKHHRLRQPSLSVPPLRGNQLASGGEGPFSASCCRSGEGFFHTPVSKAGRREAWELLGTRVSKNQVTHLAISRGRLEKKESARFVERGRL